MPYPEFDRSRLKLADDAAINTLLTVEQQLPLDGESPDASPESFAAVESFGASLVAARNNGGATILLCDAATVTAGIALHVNDLVQCGVITHVALDADAALCDFEFAHTGRITKPADSANGSLHLAELIDRFQNAIIAGDADGLGFGESLGRALCEGSCDHRQFSLLARGCEWGVPVTIHPAIGCDSSTAWSNGDVAAVARAADRDLLVLANSVENLPQGVVWRCGAAHLTSGAFLNSLALARNIAAQYDRTLDDFAAVWLSPAGDEPIQIELDAACAIEPVAALEASPIEPLAVAAVVHGSQRALFSLIHRSARQAGGWAS